MPIYVNQETGEEVEFSEHPNDLRTMLEDANKKLRDEAKARIKAEQALAPYKQKEREVTLTEALGSLGTPAIRTWLKVQPDVETTPENIAAFAEEFGFDVPQTEPTEDPSPPTKGPKDYFEPTAGQGPPQPRRLSLAEFQEMRGRDFPKAMEYAKAGLVDGY